MMLVFRYVNAADRSNPLRRMVAAHDFAVSSIFYFGSHVSIRGCTYAKGSSCLVGFQSLKRDSPSRGVSNGCLTGEFGDGFVAELAVRPGEGSNPNTRNNCAAGSSEASFPNIDGRQRLRSLAPPWEVSSTMLYATKCSSSLPIADTIFTP